MIYLTRRVIRFVGWLFIPAVAWAASFLVGWIGALAARRSASPGTGVLIMVVAATIGALVGAVAWTWALRRSARKKTVRRREARAKPDGT